MKITIDTKEDSHEEIKKIIRMLSSLVGEQAFTNQGNIFEDQGAAPGQNIFSMFDDNKNQSEEPEEQTEQSTEEKKEDDEIDIDIPDIEEYH